MVFPREDQTMPVESGMLVQPFRAATGCEVVQGPDTGAQTLDAERERMNAHGKPLTLKPSCEELGPPTNPARFTGRRKAFH